MNTRRKTLLVLHRLAVLGLVCWLNPASFTQSPKQDRIAGPVARTPYVWLEGNRRPMFRPENDLGPVAPSLKLENISLVFKLTSSQHADLTALLAEQQNPSSPDYHQWLTPEQYADRFGLSPNDIHQVVDWLQLQGFAITQTARSRTWVSFSGTAAQLKAAFQTEIHNFSLNGETRFANASEPAVPSALADVVLGIRGLDNYRFKSRSIVRRVKSEPQPNFTSSLSGNTFVAPGDFAVIYDLNALYNNGIDGTGQTIAVMGQTDLYMSGSDITAFRAASGLTGGGLTLKLVPGVTDPGVSSGDIEEASLDVEWSGAVAKNATILYVYANPNTGNGVFDALQYAIDQNLAPVVSISYGGCELQQWSTTGLQTVEGWAVEASMQGQTIVAAAGDSGAADCDYSNNPNSPVTTATHGLAVDFPGSSPYVTAMGGSEFNEGAGNYWQAATASSGDILTSALSYMPEMVWNDTLNPKNTGNGLLAGGGGVSAVFTTKPVWQTGPGVPSDNARDVPDLSLNASPIHDGTLVCVQGSCMNGFRQVSTDPSVNNTLTVVGGTSVAAPSFAGIVALVNQQHANTPPGQSNVNPILYAMAQNVPTAFHDTTTGNNIVPCASGSPNCPATAPFQIGYSAGVGYDQVTGLGSVNAYNLVMNWNSSGSGNLAAPTLTAPSSGAAAVSLPPTFAWTGVTGNAGYRILVTTAPAALPTDPAVATCGACAVSATTATDVSSYTPSAGTLAASTNYSWEVQAQVPSGGSQTAAWSSISNFTTGAADFSLSASPNSMTINPGASGTSTLTLTPVNGFSASPTLTCAASSALVGVTCAVGALSNNTATITVTASSTASVYSPIHQGTHWGGWCIAAALIGLMLIALFFISQALKQLCCAPACRRRARFMLLGAALAVPLLASLSCGGGGSGGGGGGTTSQPESGTVTITGTSNGTSHTAQITLSVS